MREDADKAGFNSTAVTDEELRFNTFNSDLLEGCPGSARWDDAGGVEEGEWWDERALDENRRNVLEERGEEQEEPAPSSPCLQMLKSGNDELQGHFVESRQEDVNKESREQASDDSTHELNPLANSQEKQRAPDENQYGQKLRASKESQDQKPVAYEDRHDVTREAWWKWDPRERGKQVKRTGAEELDITWTHSWPFASDGWVKKESVQLPAAGLKSREDCGAGDGPERDVGDELQEHAPPRRLPTAGRNYQEDTPPEWFLHAELYKCTLLYNEGDIVLVNLADIYHVQKDHSEYFHDGKNRIEDLVSELVTGKTKVYNIPLVKVYQNVDRDHVTHDNRHAVKLITHDNRRVVSFRRAKLELVPVEITLNDIPKYKYTKAKPERHIPSRGN
ncbi:unnamed protein product [Amoebophrya sp. A25]|nr:unnamed protein product [Amoebophrya sp. A25]|eukprot:GSA25T00025953001.1